MNSCQKTAGAIESLGKKGDRDFEQRSFRGPGTGCDRANILRIDNMRNLKKGCDVMESFFISVESLCSIQFIVRRTWASHTVLHARLRQGSEGQTAAIRASCCSEVSTWGILDTADALNCFSLDTPSLKVDAHTRCSAHV